MNQELPALDERALAELATRIAEIDDPRTVRALLEELLTPAERSDLARRWRLLGLLTQGVPQRRIASELGVSLCKITRGSSVLKAPRSVCRRLLSQKDGAKLDEASDKACDKA